MLIVIRGAGDLASGIALRLYRAGCRIVMTDIAASTAVRRTVSFCEALRLGEMTVEGVRAVRAQYPEEAEKRTREGLIAVLDDPGGACISALQPDAVVDAIIAKINLGTHISDAPVVIGVGPGFTAGVDCHAAVETMRGHDLGRVLYEGSPKPNTGVPGDIGGYTTERVLRAPTEGVFQGCLPIGARVRAGETAATVDGVPVPCTIDGVLRGLLADGIRVQEGMKCGDIDPRCVPEHCLTASDKARAIGGGVLEALLHFSGRLED